ncbi:hypothetical protein INT47_006015 [Mucor saturninus]|uniref:Helitron helicase-like domain-containing protein n=1 Tax=Mucor saturninus TaxID=64648 RepID=A0A8H7QH67_9FUNG|nr:hypothetical protein INT47_006015 [Mucor saturninus]
MGRPPLTIAEREERERIRQEKRKRPTLTEEEKRERCRERKSKQRENPNYRSAENQQKRARYHNNSNGEGSSNQPVEEEEEEEEDDDDMMNDNEEMKKERLIAARHVFMSVWTVSGVRGQFKCKGAINNIPVSVDTSVSSLPRSLNDTNIVPVRLAQNMTDVHNYMEGNVNPHNVWEAIYYLKTQPAYEKHDVTIDDTWLNTYDHLSNIDFNEEQDENKEDIAGGDDVIIEEDIPVGGSETLFSGEETPDSDNGFGLKMAPGERSTALSLLMDEDTDFLALPQIFGGQILEPKYEEKKLSYACLTKSLVRSADRRAVRPDYLFYMDKKKLLLNLVGGVSTMMRKNKSGSNSLKANQVLQDDVIANSIKKDEAFNVFSGVRSSPAYWKTEKCNVMAMIRQLGIPTLFITLSAAETKWLELIVILKKLIDKQEITEEEASNLSSDEIARLIQSDAPTCARYLDQRFRHLKSTWKPPHGPFGNRSVKDYYYRIEFQHRGSPHVHMLA